MPVLKTSLLEVPTDDVAARLAELDCLGVGINKKVDLLTEEFLYPFSRAQLKRFEIREVYLRVKKEHEDAVVKASVRRLKRGAAERVDKVLVLMDKAIEDGNINVIPYVFKAIGLENTENENKTPTVMQVIMPGARAKEVTPVITTKDVTNNGQDK